jgi:hypothetical protein
MSIISNHHPDVIDAVNGTQEGRPREGDQPPMDAEILEMARQAAVRFGQPATDYDPDEDIVLVGPAARLWDEPADTVTVNREALETYQAAQDRFWGLIDGVQRELERTQTCGPCAVECLSQLLKRKLQEMDAVAREFSRNKHAV